ncbi:transcriptional regulator [Brevibacterium spongiae]|uniref:Transcriptional regulator n=1 Tax=Brevibacterium spongiae TaxID=2909672 RepID=A0ABY5SQ16_9MICO|nr:transcriptional regulator [Brevibacterium spongiae]UVI36230.1 transcriptional regulator [Brevibacterium spongiae]
MGRVRFRDLDPNEIVASLEDLRGPEQGAILLLLWGRWLDAGDIDVSDPGGVRLAYQALSADGTDAIQAQLITKNTLIRAWLQLSLDSRSTRTMGAALPRAESWE